jgi:hypothetical protein
MLVRSARVEASGIRGLGLPQGPRKTESRYAVAVGLDRHEDEVGMTVYSEFTEEEQRLLRASLEAAAVAISAASPGRREETVSEGFAAASFVLDSRADHVANPLVSSLILALEEKVHAEQPFPDYVAVALAPGAQEWAMETLRAVVALLEARATADEAVGYRKWLMDIARTVAAAGKEDQGFLGRGGVQVNEAEREALAGIAGVLGVEPDGGGPA